MSVDHYENFPVASWLAPSHLRSAIVAIYHFARSADDIADEGDASAAQRHAKLDEYRQQLAMISAQQALTAPIFRNLAQAIQEHALPIQPFVDLLDAFSQDIEKTRYASFEELLDYCRRSANPVGRLLLCLYHSEQPQHLHWSDQICSSLQLINHWQDVGIDWQKQRIYLPLEDLQRFGVSETQIAQQIVNRQWQALMRFQVDRARAMMLAGAPLGRALPGRIGLELRLMIAGGLRILEKIEAAHYDVFRHRPVLQFWDWPLLIWRALTH